MSPKKPAKRTIDDDHVKVLFHRRGRDVETAWCAPLPEPHHFRIENILFLHETPCHGDVIEARPSRAHDDQLTCRRIVEPGGRYTMIVDYPRRSDFEKLLALLRRRFDIVGEGCYPPGNGEPGRLYLAVPGKHPPADVFSAAGAEVGGLIAVHPELPASQSPSRQTAKARRPSPGPVRRRTRALRSEPRRLFEAIESDDLAAFSDVGEADLGILDEHHRSLLFRAVLDGRTRIVERLLELGAAVDPTRPKQLAPLIAAALRNRPREAKLLLAAGADPALARDRDGDPVLVTAAFRENTAVVRALLSVPHPAEHKSLALLEAAGVGNLAIVKLLVKHGADPDWRSPRGNSARSIAKKKRRREVVAFFRGLG